MKFVYSTLQVFFLIQYAGRIRFGGVGIVVNIHLQYSYLSFGR